MAAFSDRLHRFNDTRWFVNYLWGVYFEELERRIHRSNGIHSANPAPRQLNSASFTSQMPESARFATTTDIPTLVELMEEFYAEAGFTLDPASAAQAFGTLLANPAYGAAWLLLDGNVPAGYVVLTVRFGMEHGGLEGYIDDLFVRSSSRRRGLARAGLAALFAECRRRGVRAVNVIVGQENAAALELYRSFGLVPPTDGRQMLTVRTS